MFDISNDYYQHGTLTQTYSNGQGFTNLFVFDYISVIIYSNVIDNKQTMQII